jgi:hypothetical protein
MKLTKLDINAMQNADSSVCFDLIGGSVNEFGTGRGRIRCYAKTKPPKGFEFSSPSEAEYFIECEGKIRHFRQDLNKVESSQISAYSYFSVYGKNSNSVSVIASFLRFLKPNDDLYLEFVADSSIVLTEAGLHTDRLYAIVIRGNNSFKFLLDFNVSPNNSSRMIKGI